MIIGCPKEIKVREYRVGLVPGGVQTLVSRGHAVLLERGAGVGSGIPDDSYARAGAQIVDSAREVWQRAQMIVKVKEPIESEYGLMQEGQTIYTYFHLAAVPSLAKALLDKKISAVAYETIQTEDGQLPLLKPMSEVAGRMAVQIGAVMLEKEHGGKGILLSGVPGVRRGRVAILGGGTVGTNAAKLASGMGAETVILDVNVNRLAYLDDIFGSRVALIYSDQDQIAKHVRDADLVVGGVLIPGAKAPKLVSEKLISQMSEGSVVVDVAVDQGGCIETCRPTTHDNPTYTVHGVVHYCVANMPGAVAQTSTFALTNTTIGYGTKLADRGVAEAAKADAALALGVNTFAGHCTYKAVADSLDLPYTPLEKALSGRR
ncbi:MAG TPA: alanine dehydrogenase [Myxococcales bacterium]|jgi:alanine dehydrogenase|nr:alanine dehydrogenase [Myxococcales bacterium]